MDGNVKKAYVCGNSRVYFRAGALEYLEAQRLIALADFAVIIQKVIRGFMEWKAFNKLKVASVKVQAKARSAVMRQRYYKIRYRLIQIQCWIRQIVAKELA